MPKISVVIPVYNKEKYVKETLQSVLNQDFNDFEIIIVDDGSTDKSLDIIKQFSASKIKIIRQENQGVAIARNTGVAAANAEIVAFLDADDLWLPNHLAEIDKLSQDFPDAGFYATAYKLKFNGYQYTVSFPFQDKYLQLKPYYRYDKGQALFYISNFAIKKDIFMAEKGFKTGIDAEDTEFFIRIGQKYALAYSKTTTMIHLNEAENSLFNQYRLERKIALLDFFKQTEQNDADLKTYLDMHRFTWTMEALINHNEPLARKLKQEIDTNNLNWKQKFLIKLPAFALRQLKNIQRKLQHIGIFWSAFSK